VRRGLNKNVDADSQRADKYLRRLKTLCSLNAA
jgi:hypothetical protein